MGGLGLDWNLNGNRNAKLQHWPFGALGSLYEVVQNSADRGFFLDHRPGASGKNFYLRCFAPLCKTETKRSLRGDRDVGGMV